MAMIIALMYREVKAGCPLCYLTRYTATKDPIHRVYRAAWTGSRPRHSSADRPRRGRGSRLNLNHLLFLYTRIHAAGGPAMELGGGVRGQVFGGKIDQ